jgi:hypothetical protein
LHAGAPLSYNGGALLACWSSDMSEKPEEDDFEDLDDAPDSDAVNVDHVLRSLDAQKRRKTKPGEEPAWRRLEQHFEKKRTQHLVEDFEDFDIDNE